MSKDKRRESGYNNLSNIDYPVFDYLQEKYKIKNMVDIGCGIGGMVKYSIRKGVEAIGIDGDKTLDIFDKPEFMFHDYTKGKFILDKNYDLGWSVEFLEHVEEKYIDNIFSTFFCCKVLCCTHGLPWQRRGNHHVNCQLPQYWLNVFKRYGFEHDRRASFHVKSISKMRELWEESLQVDSISRKKPHYMKRTGMVFIRKHL
jgi:SAM-dependent methyltransferase